MKTKLTEAEKAKAIEIEEAAIRKLLVMPAQIGQPVTVLDYVDRLLNCEGSKKISNLAKVHPAKGRPAVSSHMLHRFMTGNSWNCSDLERMMVVYGSNVNMGSAVVIEPILLWRRGSEMDGAVEIQPPGWDNSFFAQVVILASVAGTVRIMPALWRLVRFNSKNPTLEEVRCQCARQVLDTAKELRAILYFKSKSTIIVQGSDLVDFSVLSELNADRFQALIMLPKAVSVLPKHAQTKVWFKMEILKYKPAPLGEIAIREVAGFLDDWAFTPPPFPHEQYGRDFIQFPMQSVHRDDDNPTKKFIQPCDLLLGRLRINLDLPTGMERPIVRHYSLVPVGLELSAADITCIHHYAVGVRGMLTFLARRLGLADYQGLTWAALQKHLTLVGWAWALARARDDHSLGMSPAAEKGVQLAWERKLESPFIAPSNAPMCVEDRDNLHQAKSRLRQPRKSVGPLPLMRARLRPPGDAAYSISNWEEIGDMMEAARAHKEADDISATQKP